ncbi:hypothetical protein WNB94_09100 [Aquabacterium sp. A3]|uniref:hypothetical protein n=1 Tax=Aquabacterium sp. A3 TaxID=3132829 RepID=UPI0031191722
MHRARRGWLTSSLCLSGALLAHGPSHGQATHWVMPMVDNPVKTDAFGAYRTDVGRPTQIRCLVVRMADQQVLSAAQRQASFPGATFFLRQTRGTASTGGASPWQPYSVRFVDPGVHTFTCDSTVSRPDLSPRVTTVVAQVPSYGANDVVVHMSSAQGEVSSSVGVSEPVDLQVQAFTPDRTQALPVVVSSVSWSTQAAPCERPQALLPAATMTAQPAQPWTPEQGVRQAHVFKVPGTYHACVRLSSGAGQVIDKPLSLKVDANRRPLIDTFWSPQVQFGVFDARTRDRQNPVARTYPVRVRIQDDQPASVQVVFSNQQGSVPATLSSATADQAVFHADLPFSEGLQIVGVQVKDGPHTLRQTLTFMATRESLSALDNVQTQRARKGAVAFISNDVLEDAHPSVFVPASLEASFKALPAQTRSQFMPPVGLNLDVPLAELRGLPRGVSSGALLEVRGQLKAQDLRLELTRGPTMGAELAADLTLNVNLRCVTRGWGNARLPFTCPFAKNGRVGVSAAVNLRIASVVDALRDPVTGETLLALNWDDARVDRSVQVTAQVSSALESAVRDVVRGHILVQTAKANLGRTLFNCSTPGRHCRPSAPLSSMVLQGKTWVGLPLTEEGRLQRSLTLPSLFGDEPVALDYRSSLFELDLGGHFSRLVLGGAPLPADLRQLTMSPTYARATFDDENLPWPRREDLLPNPVVGARAPQPNVGLLVHVDTLNAWLAGLTASGVLNIDLSAPEFAAMLAGQHQRTTPFSALAHMPRGRVSLRFERAPRLVPRGDLSDLLALELGPVLLDIDLRQDAGSRVQYRLSAVAGVELASAEVASALPHGIEIRLPRTRCLSNFMQWSTHCKLVFGVEVLAREGFADTTVLPALASPAQQAALTTQWTALQRALGFRPLLPLGADEPIAPHHQADVLRKLLNLALMSQTGQATAPGGLDALIPLPYVVPERAIPLTGPLIDALSLPLGADRRTAIGGLTPHPAFNGLGNAKGWLGFTGQLVREPAP